MLACTVAGRSLPPLGTVSRRSISPSRIAGVPSRFRSENDFTQFLHTTNTHNRSIALCRRFENAIVSRL